VVVLYDDDDLVGVFLVCVVGCFDGYFGVLFVGDDDEG